MTGDSQEVSGSDGPVVEPVPPLRGGSLPLPGLKHWRLRKRLSQKELARRVGLTNYYLYNIESGRRGCNPETAQLLADVLQVDLEDLRRRREDALDGKAPPKPSRARIPYRNVHQAYLRLVLEGAGIGLRGDGRVGDRGALRGGHVGGRPRGRTGQEA